MDQQSLQYQLQRLEVGMVWLDRDNHVTAFNDVAWQLLSRAGEQTLGVPREQLIGIDLMQLHPPKSRNKVELLLASEGQSDLNRCPVASPPPMTMMINIPDRVLLLKVSKMLGADRGLVGACMIYYDLTELTTVHEIARDGENIHIVYEQPEATRVPVSRSHARQLREIVGM